VPLEAHIRIRFRIVRTGAAAAELARAILSVALLALPISGRAADAGIEPAGEAILQTLKSADFRSLERHVCPGSSLAFSPYARNLSTLFIVSFARRDVAAFGASRTKYLWGRYEGSGAEIRLTPREYHASFVYDADYASEAARRHLDRNALEKDPELRALANAYPRAEVVSYRYVGTANASYKDARELILVLAQRRGQWCLRGIAHDEPGV
jgi:hypothetical protein